MKKPETNIKRGGISQNEGTEGETLEQQVERMMSNNEPLDGRAELRFQERKDGVDPSMNIRTDRWELAIDATTKVHKSYSARRDENLEARKEKDKDGKAEPIHGKGEPTE